MIGIRQEYAMRMELAQTREKEASAKREFTIGEHTLRWTEHTYGKPGPNGWPLWLSLHGGGEVPQVVNDEQWQKHATLYQPANGIYLAPRAPTDTWFLWNEPHIDPLLERLIETMIATRKVDPNRIYLLGYSAGGNGVYHLAARMPDRFAAAAAMAGYPSGAPLQSLRNLPFALLVGEHDITFDRVKEARKWQSELASLHKDDSAGYEHFVRIYPDYGHWMQGKDTEALPWMAKFIRNPWPKKIVWVQDEVPHSRFYWLEIPAADAKPGQKLEAQVTGQMIAIQGDAPETMTLWLSDALIDLDQPVRILVNGKTLYQGKVPRTKEAIHKSLAARLDLPGCATACLKLQAATHTTSPATP